MLEEGNTCVMLNPKNIGKTMLARTRIARIVAPRHCLLREWKSSRDGMVSGIWGNIATIIKHPILLGYYPIRLHSTSIKMFLVLVLVLVFVLKWPG